MATNLKDTYAIKIRPDFDKKNVDVLKKDIQNIKGVGLGNAISSTTSKVAGLIGSMTLLGLAMVSIKKGFESANKGVNEFLDATDRLSTIAGSRADITSGELALTDTAIAVAGVSQQERDLLYRNVAKAQANGQLKVAGKEDLTSVLAGIQNEYKNAVAKKDIIKTEQIQTITGLRGQKATEFLLGDIKKERENIQKRTGISPEILTKNIEAGGVLQNTQITNKSINELVKLSKTGDTLQQQGKNGTLGQNIIDYQSKTQQNQDNLLQAQIKGFDASRKASESLDNTIKTLETTLSTGVEKLAPALNGIAKTVEDLKKGVNITAIAKEVGSSIGGAIKDFILGKNTSKQVDR